MKIEVTTSSKNICQDCPYQYFLAYVRRLSPRKEPLYFLHGRWVHRCLAAYHEGGLDAAIRETIAIDEETEGLLGEYTAKEADIIAATLNALPDIIGAYHLRWKDEDPFEPMGIEGKFSVGLDEKTEFKGRIDLVRRDIRDGQVYLWEIKTPGRTGPAYFDQKVLDAQVRGYLLVAREWLGLQTNKFIFDIIQKPQLKIRAGESPESFAKRIADAYMKDREQYLFRRVVDVPPHLITSYKGELIGFAEELRWRHQNAYWPRHHPGNRHGKCSYYPVCVYGEEVIPRMFRTREAMFPELEED